MAEARQGDSNQEMPKWLVGQVQSKRDTVVGGKGESKKDMAETGLGGSKSKDC